ncbi:DNA uptake protein [filamentous cyanobacterium CCP5]|nr:DNA uptake protein [filamentous cyanobacterium CCP5]
MAFSPQPPGRQQAPGLFGRWQQLAAAVHPLRTRLEQDPYCRLKTYQEVSLAASWGFRLDVNRASPDDWLRLPGLSIHQARLLSQLTATGMQFHCLEDIAAALDWPTSRLTPLAPVLSFYYYGTTGEFPQKTDLNRAAVSELAALPVLTQAQANAIARERQRGPFRDAAEFQARLRVEPELMERLLHYLRF